MPSPLRFFCDTSFFFALLNVPDPGHRSAKQFLMDHKNATLITTWDIVSETTTLLRYRLNYLIALEFLHQVKPHLELISYDASVKEEAVRVFAKFSRDKKLSLCDCLSFVILTSILSQVPVLTFDNDFKQFGFTVACEKM